ncbi:MAG TPA: 4Fe-4S dicluster domain-containing protein [Syntrophomonadaceae bacterium]|nr:4Fe-4S dicluster domain-containing protein [Syntrophomonadaceae bacterium]
MDIEKIANFIADKMSPVGVNSQQCARIRSPLSKCSNCLDICPQQRIKISSKTLSLADNCLECGLCASVCPTGALTLKEPDLIMILNKIEQAYKDKGVVNISCRRNLSVNDECIKIPCLGTLGPEIILVMRLYDFPIYFIYTEEECKSCPVKGGIDLFNARAVQVDGLIEEFSLEARDLVQLARQKENKFKERPKKHQETNIERRALFSSVFNGFRKMPGLVIESYMGTQNNQAQTTTAPKRVTDYVAIDRIEILKKYLYEKMEDPSRKVKLLYQPHLVDTCYFCKACTILCPTGALEYNEKDSEIILDSGRCSGCNLCADLCFHKSLKLMPVSLESVATSSKINFIKGHTKVCEKCQESFIASGEALICAKCRSQGNMGMVN